MKDGFYINFDDKGSLKFIIEQSHTQNDSSLNLSDFLFDFVSYYLSVFDIMMNGMRQLDIFKESLDVHYEDFEECAEYCQMIADGVEDPMGRYFAQTALAEIKQIPDDGSASFWIYQARRMVDALTAPIHAHTFISHAFQVLFLGEGTKAERIAQFFRRYPSWSDHLFEEAFWFETENETDTPKLSCYKRIRNQTELMLFCLLGLLEQETIILRCKCCGGYFVPKTKKTTLYCDRIIRDKKTCKELAPMLKRKQNNKLDATLAEYDRLYDLYYARMERYEGRVDLNRPKSDNDISADEFYIWSAKAQQLRKHYLAGQISKERFLEGLKIGH